MLTEDDVFCRLPSRIKIPAEINGILISIDISECNEINRLRRFRAIDVVFTGGI